LAVRYFLCPIRKVLGGPVSSLSSITISPLFFRGKIKCHSFLLTRPPSQAVNDSSLFPRSSNPARNILLTPFSLPNLSPKAISPAAFPSQCNLTSSVHFLTPLPFALHARNQQVLSSNSFFVPTTLTIRKIEPVPLFPNVIAALLCSLEVLPFTFSFLNVILPFPRPSPLLRFFRSKNFPEFGLTLSCLSWNSPLGYLFPLIDRVLFQLIARVRNFVPLLFYCHFSTLTHGEALQLFLSSFPSSKTIFFSTNSGICCRRVLFQTPFTIPLLSLFQFCFNGATFRLSSSLRDELVLILNPFLSQGCTRPYSSFVISLDGLFSSLNRFPPLYDHLLLR